MEIKDIVQKAHGNAVKHGFWDPPLPFGTAIALIHSELAEAGKRNAPETPLCIILATPAAYARTTATKKASPVELADAVIRIADLCGHLGIDLDAVIAEKMAYNAGRPYKHGKRF